MAMSLQEIFDTTSMHLITQGMKSVRDGIGCAYRDGAGGMCAVGCLIKDEFYNEELEKKNVNSLLVQQALYFSGVVSHLNLMDNSKFELLHRLQAIHDLEPPKNWVSSLTVVAHDFHLDSSVLH